MTDMLTDDRLATVLLTTGLALPRTREQEPLGSKEWATLVRALVAVDGTPGHVLGRTSGDLQRDLDIDQTLADRVVTLLDRAGTAAIQLQRLSDLGIWCLSKLDADYPARLKERLPSNLSPPVLFGAGSRALFSHDAIAIVGSRDADEASLTFADLLGRRCASAGLSVVSGAARGVDRTAMMAGLETGGTAIGVVADGLEKMLKASEVRRYILGDQLVLASATVPDAHFVAWRSMERNKYVYCLSNYAVVVSSGAREGGTWAGAIENMRRNWVPMFVRTEPGSPEGNQRLFEHVPKGGRPPAPMSNVPEQDELAEWLGRSAGDAQAALPWLESTSDESKAPPEEHPVVQANAPKPQPSPEMDSSAQPPVDADTRVDFFEHCWPLLARLLSEPRTEGQLLAWCAGLEKAQLKAWLAKGQKLGRIVKDGKPARFSIADTEAANTAPAANHGDCRDSGNPESDGQLPLMVER